MVQQKQTVETEVVMDRETLLQEAREHARSMTRRNLRDPYKIYGVNKDKFHLHWANMDGQEGSNVEFYLQHKYTIFKDKEGQQAKRKGRSVGQQQLLLIMPKDSYDARQYYKLEEVRDIEKDLGKKGNQSLPSEHIYGDVVTTPEVIKGVIR